MIRNFIQAYFIAMCFCVFGCSYSQNKNSSEKENSSFKSIISIVLKPGGRIILNNSFFLKPIDLMNSSSVDSLFVIKMQTSKPIQLDYTNINFSKKEIEQTNKNILLLPGDSVNLNAKLDMEYSSSLSNFIDSFMTLSDDAVMGGIYINTLNGKQLRNANAQTIIVEINKLYQNNTAKISAAKISVDCKNALSNFNLILRDKLFANIGNNEFSKESKLVTDSLYNNCLSKDIPKITSITSTLSDELMYYIITFQGKKNRIESNNFWDCFLSLDTSLQNSDAYKRIAFRNIETNFINQFDSLKSIQVKLQNTSLKTPMIDSLIKLTGILLETYKNYNQANKDLHSFDNGKYISLFEADNNPNHQPRNIAMTGNETLYNFDNSRTTFKTELFRDTAKYKYIFIDFWASWCIPCVGDYPHLKKYEDKYKQASIKFISISMDTKSNMQKWIDKTKQLGSYGNPNNFIIDSSFDSHIAKFFDIISIPRYIVINKNGNILNQAFAHPLDKDFELRLTQLLNK